MYWNIFAADSVLFTETPFILNYKLLFIFFKWIFSHILRVFGSSVTLYRSKCAAPTEHILILYKSKYGATKKFVDMLSAEFPCDIYEQKSYKGNDFSQYDWIIFCVGASPFDEKTFEEVKAQNLKEKCRTSFSRK